MAAAYHLEALRKQRVLERALEARQRIEEKESKQHHHHHHHHKRPRPVSAQGSQADPKKLRESRNSRSLTPQAAVSSPPGLQKQWQDDAPAVDHNPTGSKASQQAALSKIGGELEQQPSRQSTALSDRISPPKSQPSKSHASSRSQTPKSHASSKSSATCSKCPASASSYAPSTSSRSQSVVSCSCSCGTSHCSECAGLEATTAERRAEEVRRDLLKQELVLRDSNLVMGPVSVEQELS